MNILIVETVWMGGAPYTFLQKTLLTAFSILPTLQARELAAITPNQHKVTVLNERYAKISYETKYDVVLITFVTSTTSRAYMIADTFRKKGVPVVLSGFHASSLPEEAKQHADSVLIGRNEEGWMTVLQDIEQKKLQPYYYTPPYNTSQTLPPTNIQLPGFLMTGALEATRGCPYHCEFCPETNIQGGNAFYKRPIPEVIEEIKKIPQKTLMFYDASLTIDPSYTKELFQNMKGLHKRFFCNGNADVLANDAELVRLSKKAGCVAWLIGFESINQNTLDIAGKKTNKVTEYKKAIHAIHTNHMAVIGDFMFGFDADTPEVFAKTLNAIKELHIDVADFSILTPFPGTPLFTKLNEEKRIVTKEWTYYNMGHVVFIPKQMTSDELLQGVRLMYAEFYNPLVTIKRISRNLSRGLYPFVVVLMRNLLATLHARRLKTPKN
ncbi:MAG: B12-binding domain-containing radical SAM protein [Candidatus Thermoplasmatota archaeon]|nr:B12-binding domain-containing radical SAM protein [Candidatus Thermoplasmatota archaeon]